MVRGSVDEKDFLAGLKRDGHSGKLAEPIVHSCGRSFTYAQSYVKHAKGCDGTVPATVSPREKPDSEARRADPPRASARSAVRHKKKRDYKAERERRQRGGQAAHVGRAANGTNGIAGTSAVSPAAIIAACDVEIAKLQALKAAAAAFA